MTSPLPGAKPGETLALGPNYRWMVYQCRDGLAAAIYVGGALLRRDRRGWWRADARGQRVPVADRDVAELVGTAPPTWPVIDEQYPLVIP